MSDSTVHTSVIDAKIREINARFPSKLGPNNPPSETVIFEKKVYLVGDSLIELSGDPFNSFPFYSALSHLFRRRADVLNRGLSGYSSKWMIRHFERLERELETDGVDDVFMAIIFVGANDSVLPGNPHHVHPDIYKKNIVRLISLFTKHSPNTAILVVSPPPCSIKMLSDPTSQLSKSGRARSNQVVEVYVNALRDIVNELDLPMVKFIDLYRAIGAQILPLEDYLTDGVHLSGEGYKILFLKIVEALESMQDQLMELPMIEPHFSAYITNPE